MYDRTIRGRCDCDRRLSISATQHMQDLWKYNRGVVYTRQLARIKHIVITDWFVCRATYSMNIDILERLEKSGISVKPRDEQSTSKPPS